MPFTISTTTISLSFHWPLVKILSSRTLSNFFKTTSPCNLVALASSLMLFFTISIEINYELLWSKSPTLLRFIDTSSMLLCTWHFSSPYPWPETIGPKHNPIVLPRQHMLKQKPNWLNNVIPINDTMLLKCLACPWSWKPWPIFSVKKPSTEKGHSSTMRYSSQIHVPKPNPQSLSKLSPQYPHA